MTEAPSWLDDLALGADGPPWLSMGLARCAPEDWLWPDERRDDELGERARLLAERHAEVFAALPGTEDAGAETLALVRAWAGEHHPAWDLATDDSIHPLEAAGRLVQEDLCLMVPHGEAHHLDAACLCFPSHWRLADKLGRPAAALHGPVPRYDEELSARVDRYLGRLRPDVIGVRRNWSVHDAPDLFSPDPPAQPRTIDPDGIAEQLWLRSERQTLRRLPASGVVLFTIRVQQVPFGSLRARLDVAARFEARLAVLPDELVEMNGLRHHHDAVLTWLRSLPPA